MKTLFTTLYKEVADFLSVKEIKPEKYTLRIIDIKERCEIEVLYNSIKDALSSIPEEKESNKQYIILNSQHKFINIS